MAVTSGNGSSCSPAKPSPIAVVPTSPRQTWPSGFTVRNPVASSRLKNSQTTITGMAKNDRKNTTSPAGTWPPVDFIRVAMVTNTRTETIFSAMPRMGCMGPPAVCAILTAGRGRGKGVRDQPLILSNSAKSCPRSSGDSIRVVSADICAARTSAATISA